MISLLGNSIISCHHIFFSEPGEAPNNSPSILAMLETLQNAPHLEVHKDMIRWILKVSIVYIIAENHEKKIFETLVIILLYIYLLFI